MKKIITSVCFGISFLVFTNSVFAESFTTCTTNPSGESMWACKKEDVASYFKDCKIFESYESNGPGVNTTTIILGKESGLCKVSIEQKSGDFTKNVEVCLLDSSKEMQVALTEARQQAQNGKPLCTSTKKDLESVHESNCPLSLAISRTLKLGSKDTITGKSPSLDVTLLQGYLYENKFLNVKPNGYYGSATAKAVKAFQKANGIAQQGNVGPTTLKKLNEKIKASGCDVTHG